MEGILGAGRKGWVPRTQVLKKKVGQVLKTVFINHKK